MTTEEVRAGLGQSAVPVQFVEDMYSMRPVIVNRYTRRYFLSRDGRFRVTLDWGMQYHRVSARRFDLSHPRRDDGKVIVELKYQRNMDSDADRVSREFPCRLGKSSKYVTGVNLLYGFLTVVNTD